ncbi:hypothetical protein EXN66_Car018846 [Channa argus]|uniref:Ig-like domain-containing protein n=1 Tax=Channa argus TaxID=215402 RepID=A0A6G1QLP3_CHAAH|nr:hypothetical protein EXN66_Car018846 [Channa argus]
MSCLYLTCTICTAEKGEASSVVVRDGGDVTLPCEKVINDQDKCYGTTWLFSRSGNKAAVALFEYGKIKTGSKSKSHRLNVTENCSLVIKKVTDEDVGRYTCRQFDKSGRQQGSESVVDVSVVTMNKQRNNDKMTLTCSVSTNGHCSHTVKWLYDGKRVDKDNTDMKTSQSECSAAVTFVHSPFNVSSKNPELFKCEVTDRGAQVQQFPFKPQSSGNDAATSPTNVWETSLMTTMNRTEQKSETHIPPHKCS